jgi:hypothetical protein
MPSRNQSSCSKLWFCRSRSWGGRHGQADQRVAAADLHGSVRRERHIRRNPAPLSRRANLVRAGASFVGIAFAVLAASPFRGRAEKRAANTRPPDRFRLGKQLELSELQPLLQALRNCRERRPFVAAAANLPAFTASTTSGKDRRRRPSACARAKPAPLVRHRSAPPS